MTIKFYRELCANGYFSNFSCHPVELDGVLWPTSEHYYQAQKHAHNPLYMEAIRNVSSPKCAKNMACRRSLREDWAEVKDGVMRKVILAKFTQHPELTDKLLATGNAVLVEDSPIDAYWGVGPDGAGENKLGRILMEARSVIALAQFWGSDVLFNYYRREF